MDGTQRLIQIITHNYSIQDNYVKELFISTVTNVYIDQNEIIFKLINGLSLSEKRSEYANSHTNGL